MSAPNGLLSWGQGGTYQAIHDRNVVTALSRGQVGVSQPPTITASSGLDFLISSFLAVVACGDGSNAVVGNNQQVKVTTTAGPTSGSRTDVLWVDIDPANGVWAITLRTQADTVGRLGCSLGTITMPQNSNLATQATIAPATASYGVAPYFIQSWQSLYTVSGGGCGPSSYPLGPFKVNTTPRVHISNGDLGSGWASAAIYLPNTSWNAFTFNPYTFAGGLLGNGVIIRANVLAIGEWP